MDYRLKRGSHLKILLKKCKDKDELTNFLQKREIEGTKAHFSYISFG